MFRWLRHWWKGATKTENAPPTRVGAPLVDRPRLPLPDPRAVEHVTRLFVFPAAALPMMYTAGTRRVLEQCTRELLTALEQSGQRGETHRYHLRQRAEIEHEAHSRGVAGLLTAHLALERQIRAVGWALSGSRRERFDIRVTDTRHASWIAGERPKRPHLVWWLSEAPIPNDLQVAACKGQYLLLADSVRNDISPQCDSVVLDANPAWIERGDGSAHRVQLSISGAAAAVQAWLAPHPDSAWSPIREPAGFDHLDRDIRLSELSELEARGFVAALASRGADRSIVCRRLKQAGARVR